jgi:hypothetical protein
MRRRRLLVCFIALFSACSGEAPMTPPDAGSASEDAGATQGDLGEACTAASCAGCCLNNFCQPGITLAACGKNAGACAVCQGLDVCLPEQVCGLEVKKPWLLTVVSADVNPVAPDGKDWDFPSGDPDPFVQLNGSTRSATMNDTLFARWNFPITTTPEKLLAGSDSIDVYDDDIVAHDLIAPSRALKFSETELRKGYAEWQGWGRIFGIRFTMAPK